MSKKAKNDGRRNDLGYAFISHSSACEALRTNGVNHPRWPDAPRLLPTHGGCVARQRELARVARAEDFDELGIVSRPVDVLVPNNQLRSKGKQARTHSWFNLLPPHSLLRMSSHVLVSSPEFTLLQLANIYIRQEDSIDRSVAYLRAERETRGILGIDGKPEFEDFRRWDKIAAQVQVAQVAMEFCGMYRLPVGPNGKTKYKCQQLTSIEAIRGFIESIPPTNTYKHSTAFKSLDVLLPWVLEHSRSPMETSMALMLTLPVECGGYELPKPKLNATPERFGEHEVEADLLWEEAKLVLEYDSKEFHASKGADKIDADIERANRMRAVGYKALEVTPGLAMNHYKLDTLARQIAGLLGVSLREEDHVVLFRRSMLHKLLFATGDPS